jgi:FkbM family methyltransferase
VGANIGTYSIYAALKHFGKIKINSFEPSTSNLRVLSRNISINNYQNEINIVQLPLFNKNLAFSSMNESRFLEGAALHSFSVDYNYKGEKFNINNKYNLIGTSIDFLLENKVLSSPPNYIKIDVDGAEHLILDGAKKLLSSENKPLEILIELHKEFEDQYNKIFDIMKKYDYELINFYPGQIEYIFRSK